MSRDVWPQSQWHYIEASESAIEDLLSSNLGLSHCVARILVARGHCDKESLRDFLRPRLSNIMLPDRLPGISKAADIIATHVAEGHEIVVFGDFDADGMTAATILCTALFAIGAKAQIFIPARIQEGYGFTEAALERCLKMYPQTKLIVTVDCGISHEPACDMATSMGVEVVVTDHHEIALNKPKTASVLVNPCLPDTPEPLRHLCGAGVAFKLAHELARRYLKSEDGQSLMLSLLPIAAVGTIGDLVPLVGENRIIASCGLRSMNKPNIEHCGLRALRDESRIHGEIDAGSLAFVMVPKINAAGRVGNPDVAISLLLAPDAATAIPLARKLSEFNNRRRVEENDAVHSAEEELRRRFPDASNCPAIVLFNPEWHPGVVGLVASRLSNTYHVPSIVVTRDETEGLVRGSARCPEIPGLELVALLEKCSEYLVAFGGHRAAAGLTLKEEYVESFIKRFSEVCAEAERDLDMRTECRIEAWITPDQANAALERELSMLGPFGTLNPAPLLGIRNVRISQEPFRFGRTTTNWRINFEGTSFPGIVFNKSTIPFHNGDVVDIAFHLTRDNYGTLQFLIKDIRPTLSYF